MTDAPPTDPAPDAPAPLRSVHTSNLPQIFAEAGLSVLVTTYQAGKLVILRNNGGVLNTHFRNSIKKIPIVYSISKRNFLAHMIPHRNSQTAQQGS